MIKKDYFLIALVLMLFIFLSLPVSAKEIMVDDDELADFVSVQDAVNSASPGDVILVSPGSYNESVDIRTQNISILSRSGNPINNVVKAFGIKWDTDNITIRGFSIQKGISVEGPYSKISNNIIVDGNIFLAAESNHNSLLNNTLLKGGIWIDHNFGNGISGNYISNYANESGISLSESSSNWIENNTVVNCQRGIGICWISGSNVIRNNTVISNDQGIIIGESCIGNTLSNNTISNNNIGISASCSSTLINNSKIENNKDCGIYFYEQDTNDPDYLATSLIYNNVFNNSVNVKYAKYVGTKFWNTTKTSGTNIVRGPYIGGNLWAKPDGTGFSQICNDSDKDGICDLPYNVNGTAFDYLPLAVSPGQRIDTQIVTNESDQQYPAIYGDSIVWQDWRNGNENIYMYDLSKSKEIQITNNYSYYGISPIYGDRIVWSDSRNGNYDICMYNITTHKETQITTNESEQRNPSIFGDRIVWSDTRYGNSDIYMYDLATSTETRITSNKSYKESPTIYGDKIIWLDLRSGGREIYMYDLSTHSETQITIKKSLIEPAAIYGDRIVWADSRNGNPDIYMYNITTHKETQITTNGSEQHDPAIYGDRIVWTDYRNILETKFPIDWPTPDIYMYDLSTSKETRITTSGSARNPSIYKNRIVYEDWRNVNFDIYMCILSGEESKTKAPVADFSTNVTNGYTPLSVQFTDESQNAAGWSWDFNGDGVAVSNEVSPAYTYNNPGTYTACLTVSNANGTASKTAIITVQDQSSSDGGSSDVSDGGSSHSSGGSGGSGGSPEPQSNVEAKEISQTFIASGNHAKFDFPQQATPVVYVNFDSKKTAGKTTTIAEMLKGKSTLVSELPSDEVYKFLNIWVGNGGFATSKNIENAVVCFKVEKFWVQDKKIDKSSITLNKYSDKTWNQLPTSLSSEDDNYLYLTAQTSGFSYFAITGKTTATGTIQPSADKTQSTVNDIQNNTNTGSKAASTDQTPEQRQGSNRSGKESTKMPGFEIASGIIYLLCVFLYKKR
jgi:PGF-pre-PGF domain-containing protein